MNILFIIKMIIIVVVSVKLVANLRNTYKAKKGKRFSYALKAIGCIALFVIVDQYFPNV